MLVFFFFFDLDAHLISRSFSPDYPRTPLQEAKVERVKGFSEGEVASLQKLVDAKVNRFRVPFPHLSEK
jgi:hypothetical protein